MEVKCNENFGSVKCDRKCGKKMDCKRHVCQEVCCPYVFHECERLCGKTLKCKKHQCMMACGHIGKCHDCMEGVNFNEMFCHCGATVQYPPIPCGYQIECKRDCKRTRVCGHFNRTRHLCHSDDIECPPCMVFAPRACACGQMLLANVPCSRKVASSCGLMCKRISRCGHPCSRFCHDGACVDSSHPCQHKCELVRDICEHLCSLPCHGETGILCCPQSLSCKEMVTTFCPCSNLSKTSFCGISVNNPEAPKVLECNDSCFVKERKLRMAKAFEIDPNEPCCVISTLEWPDELVREAANVKALVLMVETKLSQFLNDPSTPYYYFPRQKSNKLVCEMCNFYGFEADIVDANIGKATVVLRRSTFKTPSIPPKLLSVAIGDNNDFVIDESLDVIPDDLLYEPNVIFATGAPLESDLKNSTNEIYKSLKLVGKLYWISDTSFFCTIEEKENSKPNEDLELLQEKMRSLMAEPNLINQLTTLQLINQSFLRASDNSLINIKRRKVSAFRWLETSEEVGWTQTSIFRNQGLVVGADTACKINDGNDLKPVPKKNLFDHLTSI